MNISVLKKKYALVTAFCAAVAGVLAFGSDAIDFFNKLRPAPEPKLIQIALSETSFGYKDSIEPRFAICDMTLRTFETRHPLYSAPRLVLLMTIQNPSDEELLITSVNYSVIEKGQVKSLEPRPLAPNKTYRHTIEWKVGDQVCPLVPVYSIPPGTTGSFEVDILASEETPPGAGVILKVVLNTNQGKIESEKIQIYLPVSKNFGDSTDATTLIPEGLPTVPFKSIDFEEMIDSRIVNNIIEVAGLREYCDKAGFDGLERDLMFHFTACRDFDSYIKIESVLTQKTYEEMFPKENLKYFWDSARAYIRDHNN